MPLDRERARAALLDIGVTMTNHRIVNTWYQVRREDGSLWAETSSRAEAILHGQLADGPVTYQVMSTIQYDGPWHPLTPTAEEIAQAKAEAAQWDEDDNDLTDSETGEAFTAPRVFPRAGDAT